MNDPDKRIQNVVVLGGGSAGFMAALALKTKMPDLSVTVIRSKDIGIIGVGEGSTTTLTEFIHRDLRVNPKKFYEMTEPTWKLGLKFVWGARDHFYYSFDSQQLVIPRPGLQKPVGFYDTGGDMDDIEPMAAMMAFNRAFPRKPDGNPQFQIFAYHIENDKYVAFLEAFAASLGIAIVEDTVATVLQDEAGITGLVLKSGRTQSGDLYLDCSGFYSLLLGKTLQEPFISFRSSLFCDRAVVGGWTRQGEPILPYTTCETMNSGWCWQIEHVSRINRGYVYCSDFISDEVAEREFRAKAPRAGPSRVVKFIAGRYERNWVKNVVAIGNATGFVEPLEATSLGVISVQSRLLADSLVAADRQIRETHRRYVNRHHCQLWDSIRGFIAIHYKYNTRFDTPFWKECREKTDVSVGAGPAEYYQENGPAAFWDPTVVGPFDPFGIGGWITLFLGQSVPYKHKHRPMESEKQAFNTLRERNRAAALAAMTSEEALAIINSPTWRWT